MGDSEFAGIEPAEAVSVAAGDDAGGDNSNDEGED
jgi:hypothetical protein